MNAGDVSNCITIPIEIPIKASGFTDISGFTVQVAYDPALMSFDGVSKMNNLLNNGTLTFNKVTDGILEISYISSNATTLLSGASLLSVNFVGLSSGRTELKWNLTNCLILSASKSEMPAIYTDGAVDIRPVPQIYTSGGDAYCEGASLKLNAGSLTGQLLTYEWVNPNGESHTGPEWNIGSLDMSAAGEYRVTASDGPACSTTETLNVHVYPNPQIKIAEKDTLCSDQEVTLNAGTGFTTYKWQDGSTEPKFVATAEGLYWVVVSDENGCKASDSVLLRQCDLLLWMPNAFTPYKIDGHNDVFLPEYRHDVHITFQMLIFNKWGEQIFSTNDISKGWDGTYKGVLCTQDLYTWIITFSTPDNYKFLQKSPQTGNVMLLK
jgi:gliding motility-associated-like protein